MSGLHEKLEFFAAVLWSKPMTESEMRTSEAFRNYSVDMAIMMLERMNMIFYKGDVIHVKKAVAKKLGDHVQVHIEDNCTKCKGTGIKGEINLLGQANWPCDKCGGTGKLTVRDQNNYIEVVIMEELKQLRKDLCFYGISAPESDEELACEITRYQRRLARSKEKYKKQINNNVS